MLLALLTVSAAATPEEHTPSMKPMNLDDDDVFLVDYKELYNERFSRSPFLFYLLTGFLIVSMFYMMYVMADKHLTWTLEHLSRYCRMSPDMAGMTFLAFGNGAPDFFTAVFGASRSPDLILSSSIGSGLFTISVVLGLAILLAAKQKDISFGNALSKAEEGKANEPQVLKSTPLVTPEGTIPNLSAASKRILNQPKVAPTSYMRNALLYGVCVAFLTLFTVKKEIPLWQPLLLIVIYFGYMSSVVGIHYYQELQAKKAAKRIRRSFSGQLAGESNESIDNTSMKMREAQAFQELEELPLYHRIPAAIIRTSWTFAERTGVTPLDVVIFFVKLPVDLLFNLTVLPMESIEDAATCPPHMAAVRFVHRLRSVLCPWGFTFLAATLVLPETFVFTAPWWLGSASVAAVLSVYMYFTTSNRADPKFYPVHVALAFVTCILWIYAVSSDLVSCLGATGELAGISPTIMGIVVLAWGNSFGDLVADVALSRNGHFQTAVAAAFCGPVQNVLLTIGVSFVIACARAPGRVLRFPGLGNDIFMAIGTLVAVLLMLLIVVPLVGRFRVPRWLGWTLLGIYLVYLPMAVLGGLGVFPFLK